MPTPYFYDEHQEYFEFKCIFLSLIFLINHYHEYKYIISMIFNRITRLSTSLSFNILIHRPLYMVNMARRNPNLQTQREQYLQPFTISNLYNNKGSRRYPKQLGRGPGSGKGKFAGRGMKGQKARAGGGGIAPTFQGGQTPIQARIPKFGRVKRRAPKQIFDYVNLWSIHYFIQKGILKKHELITIKTLNDVGLVKKVKHGVKILGKGAEQIDYPIRLQVTDASKTAIRAIQNAGGSVQLVFRTQLKLKQHLYPEKFPIPLREPVTAAWKVRKLERKSKDRQVQIQYKKPLWKVQEQNELKELESQENSPKQKQFVYPVPRVPNPERIRTRKPKLFKKISYNL